MRPVNVYRPLLSGLNPHKLKSNLSYICLILAHSLLLASAVSRCTTSNPTWSGSPRSRPPGWAGQRWPSAARAQADGRPRVRVADTVVAFKRLTPAEIDWYVASGEGMGKAGGYAIQGGAERFISHLAGSYSGVMGLPLQQTAALLAAFAAGADEDSMDKGE